MYVYNYHHEKRITKVAEYNYTYKVTFSDFEYAVPCAMKYLIKNSFLTWCTIPSENYNGIPLLFTKYMSKNILWIHSMPVLYIKMNTAGSLSIPDLRFCVDEHTCHKITAVAISPFLIIWFCRFCEKWSPQLGTSSLVFSFTYQVKNWVTNIKKNILYVSNRLTPLNKWKTTKTWNLVHTVP